MMQSQVVLRQPSRTVLLNSYFEQCIRTEISNRALCAQNRAPCTLNRPLHPQNRALGFTEQCLCAQNPSLKLHQQIVSRRATIDPRLGDEVAVAIEAHMPVFREQKTVYPTAYANLNAVMKDGDGFVGIGEVMNPVGGAVAG